MLTAPNTKENGKMTNNMERDMNHGPMAANSMVFTLNLRKREEACIHGLMATNTLETGLTISFPVLVYIPGVMEGSTLDNGKITSCMVRELTNGLMAGCTTENTRMIRRMALVFMCGWTDVLTSAIGSKENRTMNEYTYCLTELLERVSMRAITEKNGCPSLNRKSLNSKKNFKMP